MNKQNTHLPSWVNNACSTGNLQSFAWVLKKIYGTGYVPVIYILSSVYMIFSKNDHSGYLFGIYNIICFILVLNPLFCNLIAEYITGTEVYWRLFWMLQINICIAVCVADIYERIGRRYVAVAAVILLCLSGRVLIAHTDFEKAENPEKIAQIAKEVSNAVISYDNDEHKRLMIPEGHGYGVREYTGDIELAWSRYSRHEYEAAGTFAGIEALEYTIYSENTWTDEVSELLERYGINYVVFNRNMNNIEGMKASGSFSDIIWENEHVFLVHFDKEKAT